MTTLRSGAGELAPRVHVHTRALAIALAAALAVALTALVIVLATSSDSSEPVRVAPTADPGPPTVTQQVQPPGVNGPGAQP